MPRRSVESALFSRGFTEVSRSISLLFHQVFELRTAGIDEILAREGGKGYNTPLNPS
jgi:hypothetical protein